MKSYNEWKNEKLDEIAPATDVDQMAGQPVTQQAFNMSKAAMDAKQDMRAAGMVGAKALQQAQQMLQELKMLPCLKNDTVRNTVTAIQHAVLFKVFPSIFMYQDLVILIIS